MARGADSVMASAIRVVLILSASTAVAAVYVGSRGLDWVPDVQKLTAHQQRVAQIRKEEGVTLDEFLVLIEQGAIAIDARPAETYEHGHLFIESAFVPVLNIPAEHIAENLDRLMEIQSLGAPIVLYCSSVTCDYAEDVYIVLEEYGFANMKIYFEGWEGILAANLPTETGPDTWTGFDDGFGEPSFDESAAFDPNSIAPDALDPNTLDPDAADGGAP